MSRKPAPSPTGIYVAQSSGVFRINGKLTRYHVGETFPEGHPLLEIRPGSFRPLTFPGAPVVAEMAIPTEIAPAPAVIVAIEADLGGEPDEEETPTNQLVPVHRGEIAVPAQAKTHGRTKNKTGRARR